MNTTQKILVTGAAGFIGYHLCQQLLKLGHEVVGLDNINDYYDVNLKYARLENLGISRTEIIEKDLINSQTFKEKFSFIKLDLTDKENLDRLFTTQHFTLVCNLAAQAGVRYSLENPSAYVDSNLIGFVNILECCRHHEVKKLVYASSSSVYGANTKIPFSTSDSVDHPISLYAASKKSNELMAHTYSHLFGFETVGLRFFTVYGPWGRPDMAMFLFTDAILNNRPIKVFNNGNLSRDFTYIDDIIAGVIATLLEEPKINKENYRIYNIGNSQPVKLLDFINCIEEKLNLPAEKQYLPMQAGDVEKTWADVSDLQKDYNYTSKTDIRTGVSCFIDWYQEFYKIS